MAPEIVHDDDIAGMQNLNQLLFDVSEKAGSIDRAVKNTWCRQPIMAQSGNESHGPPASMRRIIDKPLTLHSPTPDRGHIGLDPCLVDKHQTFGINPTLPGFPATTLSGNAGASPAQERTEFF